MSYRLIYDVRASVEFREAVTRYESEAEGLGVRFILEIDKVISAISSQPLRFSKIGLKGRRARVLGWPYTIYFVVNEAQREIKVVAVWHGARNPAELLRRLK